MATKWQKTLDDLLYNGDLDGAYNLLDGILRDNSGDIPARIAFAITNLTPSTVSPIPANIATNIELISTPTIQLLKELPHLRSITLALFL